MKVGDRVKYSHEWLKILTARRYEIAIEKRGIVTGITKYIHVQWDRSKKSTHYAKKFIEVDE
jgi:hypothetical protein